MLEPVLENKLITSVPAKGEIIAPTLEKADETPIPAFLKRKNIYTCLKRIYVRTKKSRYADNK